MKWAGKIGFATSVETSPGVWRDKVVEKSFIADVTRYARRDVTDQVANNNLVASHEFSIVLSAYLATNWHSIRYIHWMGARWRVTHAEVLHPRLRLQIGGVYNGPTP